MNIRNTRKMFLLWHWGKKMEFTRMGALCYSFKSHAAHNLHLGLSISREQAETTAWPKSMWEMKVTQTLVPDCPQESTLSQTLSDLRDNCKVPFSPFYALIKFYSSISPRSSSSQKSTHPTRPASGRRLRKLSALERKARDWMLGNPINPQLENTQGNLALPVLTALFQTD